MNTVVSRLYTLTLLGILLTACATAPTTAAMVEPNALPASSDTPIPQSTGGSAAVSSNKVDITIQGFAFDPVTLTVKKGTTVTWTNKDSAPHTVTADDGSWGSGTLAQGASYTWTFTAVGTYAYHCQFHGMMKATIIVAE